MFRISYISETRDWHGTFRINNNDSLHSFLALNSLQRFFHLSLQTEKAQINRRFQLLLAFHQSFEIVTENKAAQRWLKQILHTPFCTAKCLYFGTTFSAWPFQLFSICLHSSLICDYNLVETWNSPLIFPSLLLPNPPTTSHISSLL